MDQTLLIVLFIVTMAPIVALAISNMKLWIELKAMQKSTHQIQFIDPLQQQFTSMTDEEKKILQDDPFKALM